MKSFALLSLALLAGTSANQEPSALVPPQGAERTEFFDWWDALDFPTVDDAPAVRVHYIGGEVLGFLISESESSERVFLTNLREINAVELDHENGDGRVATYERVDFAESVLSYLDNVRTGRRLQRDMFGLPGRAQLVYLARICEQRGLDELVHPLLAEAIVRREFGDRRSPADTRLSLRERVWGDLAHTLQLRTWMEPGAQQRLDAFALFARRFPESLHAAQARHFVVVLERMADEDARIPSAEELSTLAGDRLIEALVLRLRYLRGHGGRINGGPPSTFAKGSRDPPNEADLLVALGEAAVPALVAACDDDTLTRIAYPGRADWNPVVTTVGDCAGEVLRKITGKHFTAGPAQWKSWWLRRHREGEVGALIDSVLAQDAGSLEAARLLLVSHPVDALWPVELGVVESGTDWANLQERLLWIELYASIDHPRVARFLAEQARGRGRLTHRVAAALALERSDPASALVAAERLAYHLSSEGHTSPNRGRGNRGALVQAENEAARRLIDFLAERGANDVLANHFARQRPHLRAAMARSVATHTYGERANHRESEASRENAAAAVRLLRLALADTDVLEDLQEVSLAEGVSAPRVCDIAALTLHRSSPERFVFGADGNPVMRDAQVREIRIALNH